MLFRSFRTAALAALCVVGCNSDDGAHDAGSCPSAKVTDACVQPAPTWADVLPIIQARCGSCHKEDAGQWPLDQYQYVIDWEPSFVSDIVGCTMPPRDAGIELTQDERTTILDWIGCGAPQ